MGLALVPTERYAVVPRHFYSPLPDLARLDEGFWDTPRPMPGVDLAVEQAIELLVAQLAPYIEEFEPPADRPDYTFASGSYGIVDAESLYAIVRWLKPKVLLSWAQARRVTSSRWRRGAIPTKVARWTIAS